MSITKLRIVESAQRIVDCSTGVNFHRIIFDITEQLVLIAFIFAHDQRDENSDMKSSAHNAIDLE